ncbi:MAG: hypothetical protein ACOCV2_07745 [Persicimonas sp.]
MAERSYSVVVSPDQWSGSLEELARAIKPVSGHDPRQVLPLLARGPMTLEADLSLEEARGFLERLDKLSVPTRVVDEEGEVVARCSGGGSDQSKQAAKPSVEGERAKPTANDSVREPDPVADADSESPEDGDEDWSGFLTDIDSTFGAEPVDSNEKPEPSPGATPPPQPPSPGPPAATPSLTNSPTSTSSEFSPDEPTGDSMGAQHDAGGFDAGRMAAAFEASEEAGPPYRPDGFDDSFEHVPAVAALLSLFAPGAGQVYNGQGDRAPDYAWRFIWLKPWYESVRQAYEHAEKIRTYWAPRPDSGSFVAALRFFLVFWVIVGPLAAGLIWSGTMALDSIEWSDEPEITEADVESAVDRAYGRVDDAHLEALDGVSGAIASPDEDHQRFTMSDEERSERLFRRGIGFCEQGEYGACQDAMKKVADLNPRLRRYAFRLQTWASVNEETGGGEPMPEFESVETLAEYEKARQEADSKEELVEEFDEVDDPDEIDKFERMAEGDEAIGEAEDDDGEESEDGEEADEESEDGAGDGADDTEDNPEESDSRQGGDTDEPNGEKGDDDEVIIDSPAELEELQ